MLTRHKSSWLSNLNRTPKMKPWNALTVEEETASGKNINAKILQNLSAAFLQFSSFTTITFLEDNVIIRIGESISKITFYVWKKTHSLMKSSNFQNWQKMRRTFAKQRRSRDFDIVMKCLRIAFEDYPKKVKKTEAKFRFSEPFKFCFSKMLHETKKTSYSFLTSFIVVFKRVPSQKHCIIFFSLCVHEWNQQRKNESFPKQTLSGFSYFF